MRSQHLGCLPIVNCFLARMGVAERPQTYLPGDDARLRLAPAAVIAVVVRNIVVGHRPLYALGEWAPRSTTKGQHPHDVTHVPTWDELHALAGRADFLYVADSKLCSKQAMGHIASYGGRFVTVVPHGRREDTWFRDWAQTHAPAWQEAHRRPGARAR